MIRSYTMMKTGSTTGTVCHQGKRIKPDHGPTPEDHDPRKLPLGGLGGALLGDRPRGEQGAAAHQGGEEGGRHTTPGDDQGPGHPGASDEHSRQGDAGGGAAETSASSASMRR